MENFSFMAVVERSLKIFRKDLPLFFGIGLLVNLPFAALIVGAQFVVAGDPQRLAQDLGFEAVVSLSVALVAVTAMLVLLANSLTTAAVLHGVFRSINGERATFGECLQTAMANIGPVIAFSLVTGIAITLGSAMCLLPGLYLLASWYVGLPAVIAERTTAVEGMSRSQALTADHLWEILGLALVAFAVEGIAGTVLSPVTGALWSSVPVVAMVVDAALRAFFHAFRAVLAAVAYHDLRVGGEGVDSHELASVFD